MICGVAISQRIRHIYEVEISTKSAVVRTVLPDDWHLFFPFIGKQWTWLHIHKACKQNF